ncbi:hypothetical protein [Streptococcus respiraculi]|uniref:hypothetical protein n=1 Tax=Streptococcus respiraculi TaxID=2021971 RepID=UPI000E74D395|nr:hypothetical protein [Streptococcus respiraculi]
MKVVKREGIFLLVVIFMYIGFPTLIPFFSSDTMFQKALYVNHVIIYIPVVLLLTSLIYSLLYGFKLCHVLYVFLLFPLTVVIFQEWIFIYQMIYSFLALLGGGVGHLMYRLRKGQ